VGWPPSDGFFFFAPDLCLFTEHILTEKIAAWARAKPLSRQFLALVDLNH